MRKLFEIFFVCLLFSVAAVHSAVVNESIAGMEQEEASDHGKKVLAVMSYHAEYPWQKAIRNGIESTLIYADIKYINLDTKRNKESGPTRAREAFRLYQEFQPDLVIAADDNAQTMFVIPYLKDKVETPVIFCGVNDFGDKHGYPTSQITGILEANHYREGIILAQLIDPQILKIGVIMRDTISNRGNAVQLEREKEEYTAEIAEIAVVASLAEADEALAAMQPEVDALLYQNLAGIRGPDGEHMKGIGVIAHHLKTWHKPTISDSDWGVKAGILCAVAKTGEEQGATAAEMALEVFSGKSISDIPVVRNRNGRRVINVSTASRLGLELKPIVLLGTELVK